MTINLKKNLTVTMIPSKKWESACGVVDHLRRLTVDKQLTVLSHLRNKWVLAHTRIYTCGSGEGFFIDDQYGFNAYGPWTSFPADQISDHHFRWDELSPTNTRIVLPSESDLDDLLLEGLAH